MPVLDDVPPKRRFVFSFRYYKQDRYFGLGAKDSGWFSAVLQKLSEISDTDYETLMSDYRAKQVWRLHEINWTAKGMPFQKADLDWIDSKYLQNDQEFPFFQFQITQAHGRIIGFWDEDGAFNGSSLSGVGRPPA